MKLLQLPPGELRRQLAGSGIWLRTGPFSLRVRSRVEAVAEGLGELYGQFEVRNPRETFADFHIGVDSRIDLRRGFRPEAWFSFDGANPVEPMPRDQAFAMFERGIDWCLSEHSDHYLTIRAAAVEKNDRATILVSPSESSISALTAALVLSGWRLLSGEPTLVERGTGLICPLPRPICLHGEAIALIRAFNPEAVLSSTSQTSTHAVAFMRPPKESVRRQHEPAVPAWIVFPHCVPDGEPLLRARSRRQTFDSLTRQALNFGRLGREGGRVCARLARHAAGFDLQYGRLEEAVALFEGMDSTVDSAPDGS